MADIWVRVNEEGRRVGEDHPKARYTDDDVELVRELRAAGWQYKAISEKMEMPVYTVKDICLCRIRAQPWHLKRVRSK